MYIYQKIKLLMIGLFFLSFSIGQEVTDTTAVVEEEEGSGREMYTSVDVSYSEDKGNTDFLSLYYGLNFMLIGDLGPFKDTEFLFDFNRSDDQFDGDPFSDDQALTLKFDVWANQRFSPFLFYQKSFDNVIGLQDRVNYGLGAKVGVTKIFSVSYAFLFEKEDYLEYSYTDSTLSAGIDTIGGTVGTGDWYGSGDSILVDYEDFWHVEYDDNQYYQYTDSTTYFDYTDSTEAPAEEFFRHSIRPKIKIKLFNESLVFDYRFYYKPKVDDFEDYLLEHELKVSIATFYEALTIDLNYSNKYNARYDGVNIINRETGVPYKAVDENISLGFSFMF